MLYEDPENVYFWAQEYVKFKNNAQPTEVIDLCKQKIEDFLEAEEDKEDKETTENTTELSENDEADTSNEFEETEVLEEPITMDFNNGLSILYEIIRLCHNKTKHGTGFTLPFDFLKYIPEAIKIPYVKYEAGTYSLSSKSLKNFITNYLKYCADEGKDFQEIESFWDFLDSQHSIQKNANLERHINDKWNSILERIQILQRIEDVLSSQFIGLIEVKNLAPADSQKIFNLINSQGTPLKAVEILSARPKWNQKIQNPNAVVVECVKKLYKEQMGITPDGVVRWDMAATFIRRLDKNLIFKDFSNNPTDYEKELTTAFKCLSGIYTKGITKIDIDKLVDCPINWETDIDALVSDFNNMINIIEGFPYFNFLKQWNVNIQQITSDGIAYEFALLCYHYFKTHGKPLGYSSEVKKFQKECFILWDKLIYEYVDRQWKGSSDSKVHNEIENPQTLSPIITKKWIDLLDEMLDKNMINGKVLSYTYLKPILYHVYCLLALTAPASAHGYDIDHIIPQDLFDGSHLPDKETLKDNLFNLALLPKKDNISKSNNKLSKIDDPWLEHQILDYEFIPKEKYSEFSDVTNYKALFEYRKPVFIEALDEKRTYLLNN